MIKNARNIYIFSITYGILRLRKIIFILLRQLTPFGHLPPSPPLGAPERMVCLVSFDNSLQNVLILQKFMTIIPKKLFTMIKL